ncbi:hypothetical protein [Propionivibrio sp.]|uniref:hypothetical protein n=1 Tax=Propionivibrio sp. TaxID=2212460 RepID=UPI003BF2E27E
MNLLRALCCLLLAFGGFLPPASAEEGSAYTLASGQTADFSTILGNRNDKVSVFEYGGRALIQIIDFPNLPEQGRMFNRVVALIERIGASRTRVMNNDELAQFIRSVGKNEATFAYGNDFLVSELVVFFNLADMGGIQLNAEEVALRRLLLDYRLMVERTGFFQAIRPQAVILSIPQETLASNGGPQVTSLARKTILMHEISHAVFYTNPLYANYCRQFWKNAMSEGQRAAFRKFLSNSSYNPDNEEMMVNETQAYLLYTPDQRAFNARLVGLTEKEIESLRAKFLGGFPEAPLAELRR